MPALRLHRRAPLERTTGRGVTGPLLQMQQIVVISGVGGSRCSHAPAEPDDAGLDQPMVTPIQVLIR